MRRPRKRCTLIFLFLATAGVISAQQISWESSIDWARGELRLVAEAPIDRSGANAPAAAHRAEQEIQSELAAEVVNALLPLRIDSRETLAGELQREPSLYGRLASLADNVERLITRPDRSLSRLQVTYRLDLFPGLPPLLLRDDLPLPFRRILGWIPAGSYTGVVIYAAEPLPIHGTELRSTIVPALLPEIFDENMETVLSREQLEVEWMERWGVAAYTDSLDLSDFTERVGQNPKRILARRLFGVSPTDIVISNADARELLATEGNRRLLREGRILIVTPTD